MLYFISDKIYYSDKIYLRFAKIKLLKHTIRKEALAQVISKNTFFAEHLWVTDFKQVTVYHYTACRQQNCWLVLVEELKILFCSNYWQNPPVTAKVHYFHWNSHHFHYHCKMHFYRLKILLTILFIVICMIPCLFQLNFVFFLPAYIFGSLIPSFSFFTPSKRSQN